MENGASGCLRANIMLDTTESATMTASEAHVQQRTPAINYSQITGRPTTAQGNYSSE